MLDSSAAAAAGYVLPRYVAPQDATWFHVLHGNIPNHQIDFMYCPEVPQGLITPTHFSHMTRLMKYIEPQTHASHAFAIGNLSRDDTQHEPGHGGLGIIFGMRIGGATDHAGRQNPPFAHGVLTVDRELTHVALLEASATFYRHVMYAGEAQSTTSDFYKAYVRTMVERPHEIDQVLTRYVDDFNDLPRVPKSRLAWEWEADEDAVPRRVTIVHEDGESFGAIAQIAARIGSLLYRSSIKWTAITTGREADIPGGVSVRFVSERDVTAEDRRSGRLHKMDELSTDEATLAADLFGARHRGGEERKYVGWRERFASQAVVDDGTNPLANTGSRRNAPPVVLQEREREAAREAAREREPAREREWERGEPPPPGHKYTDAGTEIMKRAPAQELLERGLISEADAMPGGRAAAAAAAETKARQGANGVPVSAVPTATAPAEKVIVKGSTSQPPAAAPSSSRAGSAAAKPGGTRASTPPPSSKAGKAGAAKGTPVVAPAREWRDVDAAPAGKKKAAAAAAAAAGADDIEITVDAPSSSKKWVWALLAVAVLGAGGFVAVKMPERVGLEGVMGSVRGASTPPPAAPEPTQGATPQPQPTTTQNTAPATTQTTPPAGPSNPGGAKDPGPADTGKTQATTPTADTTVTPTKRGTGGGGKKGPATATTTTKKSGKSGDCDTFGDKPCF